jgi:hypothetical protein
LAIAQPAFDPRRLHRIAIVCFAVTLLVGATTQWRAQRFFGGVLRGWDAQFYYALALSITIDADVDITNNIEATPYKWPFDRDLDGTFEALPRRSDGRVPSKYPIGLSLIESPFVVVGRSLSALTEPGRGDGFDPVVLWTVSLGLVAVFAVGTAMLLRLLLESHGVFAAVVGVAAAVLGTSLFYYGAVFTFMTHAVSFTLLVVIMWCSRMLTGSAPGRAIAALGASTAALFLVRPQQSLIAVFLLPWVAAQLRHHRLSRWLGGAITGVAACGLAAAAGIAFSRSQFGGLALDGYSAGGEGFNWTAPDVATVLVSDTSGLLTFSPVVLLALVGLLAQPARLPPFVWPQVLNALAQVYIVAAWSSPDQGDTFGARMLADNAGVVAVGVSALAGGGSGRRAAVAALVAAAATWTTLLLVRYVVRG